MITLVHRTDPRLTAALDRLRRQGVLDATQAEQVAAAVAPLLAAPEPEPADGLRGRLAEIAGYVGGAFVIGATFLFVGQQWDELGRTGRVAILVGVALVTAIAGVLVAGTAPGPLARLRTADADPVRRRLASTLFTGAAAAVAFAVGLAAADPTTSGSTPVALGALAGLLAVQAGYRVAPSVVGQAGTAAAAVPLAFAGVDALRHSTSSDGLVAGLVVVAGGALWLSLLRVAWWRERRAACGFGAGLALFGAQYVVATGQEVSGGGAQWVGYLLTAAVVVGSFLGYTRNRAWPLLAVGVIGATALVPEVLLDVTGGSLGSSGVMLVAGVTLLATSAVSLRLRRPDATPPPGDAAGPDDPAEPTATTPMAGDGR